MQPLAEKVHRPARQNKDSTAPALEFRQGGVERPVAGVDHQQPYARAIQIGRRRQALVGEADRAINLDTMPGEAIEQTGNGFRRVASASGVGEQPASVESVHVA